MAEPMPEPMSEPLACQVGPLAGDRPQTGAPAIEARAEAWQVLIISGLCGMYLGMAGGWQVAIESAQAVAGLVSYPADNPFYMYHLQTWTLLHQVPALLLCWGVSERMLAVGIGGLIGMASFQGLALTAYALCRGRMTALAVPLVCLAANACKDNGGIYPIRLLSDRPWVTYGAAGTSLALLAWALPAAGFYRLGGLAMGIAPAIHPTLGGWCLAIGLAGMAWQRRAGGSIPAPLVRYLLAGCLVTAGSLSVHLFLARGVPDIDPAEKDRYVSVFAAKWDSHRKVFPLDSPVVLLGCATVVMTAMAASRFGSRLLPGGMLLMRALMLSSVAALLLCVATQWQHLLPRWVVMAMPGRFINITGLAVPAVLLGLLGRWHRRWPMAGLLAGLMVFFLLRMFTLEEGRFYVPSASKVLICASMICVALVRWPAEDAAADAPGRMGSGVFGWLRPWALASLGLYSIPWKGTDVALSLLMLAALVFLLVLGRRAGQGYWASVAWPAGVAGWFSVGWMSVALLGGWFAGLAAAMVWLSGRACGPASGGAGRSPWRGRWLGAGGAVACGLLAMVLLGMQAAASWSALKDWRNDPVFAGAARGRGLLLTASRVRAVQLRTRRPVLLEGAALNQLPYVPASGPPMNRILNRVYGEDLFHPRFKYRKDGGLSRYTGKRLWEARDVRTWARLASEFGFCDVLTYGDWRLKLPVVARTDDLVLYHVPESRSRGALTRR